MSQMASTLAAAFGLSIVRLTGPVSDPRSYRWLWVLLIGLAALTFVLGVFLRVDDVQPRPQAAAAAGSHDDTEKKTLLGKDVEEEEEEEEEEEAEPEGVGRESVYSRVPADRTQVHRCSHCGAAQISCLLR